MGNKKSLFDITLEQKALINEIELMEGEITPEVEEKLKINQQELQVKSVAYLEVIGNRESFNERIDNEIKRLQGIKKVNNNLIGRLKDNLLEAVKSFGGFTVGTQKFGTRKSSAVVVGDVNSLPEKYKVKTVTEAPDKTLIKTDLKAGKEIEGCYIQKNLNLKIN